MNVTFDQLKTLKEKYDNSSPEDLFIELSPLYNKYWLTVLSEITDIGVQTLKLYKGKKRKPTFGNYVLLFSMLQNEDP